MFVTLWTIRIAATLYLAAVLLRITRSHSAAANSWARACWTAGFVLYVVHVFCAFQYVHHWNHAVAYEETARRTRDTVGVAWGAGIYVNYLFGAVWGWDVARWWRDRAGYESRSLRTELSVHLFLAFIMFNACVVFAPKPMLWWGLAGTGVLLLALGHRWIHARPATENSVASRRD